MKSTMFKRNQQIPRDRSRGISCSRWMKVTLMYASKRTEKERDLPASCKVQGTSSQRRKHQAESRLGGCRRPTQAPHRRSQLSMGYCEPDT